MKVYLSSQFGRQLEMQHYANDLSEAGWDVSSSWINSSEGGMGNNEDAFTDEMDMDDCDAIILFTGPPWVGTLAEIARGSRHYEFGYCRARSKMMFVIGPYENLFQKMPHVIHFDDWATFMRYVRI